MKIKRKVQKNLPQLIEWAMDNDVRNECFLTHDSEGNISEVSFDIRGLPKFSSVVDKSDTFTVTIKEEITEDTVIEKLYHTTIPSRIVESGCSTIKSTLEHSTVEPIAFYILNDDLTMTLIWRNGKLVE